MSYYKRLRDLREDHDLLQRDIANLLQINQFQYSRWETGSFEIPVRYLIKLADYYDVSMDYIVGRTNNKRLAK